MKKPAAKSPAKTETAAPAPAPQPRATISLEPFTEPSPQEIKKEGNPFSDRDWRMWSYAWSGFALRLMLVFGTAFSAYQYMTARQEKRVERTLALVELWERPEYQAAQKALKERLTDLNTKNQNLLGSNPSDAKLAVYYRQIGQKALTADGGAMPLNEFQANFDRVIYFLNRLSACASANLCAPEMADEYFRDYARSFWSYFAGYIQEQRKAGTINLAQPLEAWLKKDDQPAPAPQDAAKPPQ